VGNRKVWKGQVVGGARCGVEVEVRASGEPLPIFVIAYHGPVERQGQALGFAVGPEALRRHFEALDARVVWRERTTTPSHGEGHSAPGGGEA